MEIMSTCRYQTVRSKKYVKYLYCRHPNINNKIDYNQCLNCNLKEYKNKKPIPIHKKTRTIATSIKKSVKEIVWERDNHQCILCGKYVPLECACCHFIPRSQGGLGIPENIFTACNNCHNEQDNGKYTLELGNRVEQYLRKIYGKSWNKNNLIYKKEMFLCTKKEEI